MRSARWARTATTRVSATTRSSAATRRRCGPTAPPALRWKGRRDEPHCHGTAARARPGAPSARRGTARVRPLGGARRVPDGRRAAGRDGGPLAGRLGGDPYRTAQRPADRRPPGRGGGLLAGRAGAAAPYGGAVGDGGAGAAGAVP